MAGILLKVGGSPVSIAPNTTRTVLQLQSASNHRIKLNGFSVSFKGIASNEPPYLVQLTRQQYAAISGTSITPVHNNPLDTETIQCTASAGNMYVSGTSSILQQLEVHPQGSWQIMYPYGQEVVIPGVSPQYLGLNIISQSTNSTTDCVAQFDIEE